MAYHPFRHLGLKVLSVAIAFGLWFTVAGERTVERTLRAPLQYESPPASLEMVEFPPAAVEVQLRGTSTLLSQLSESDVVTTIDLSKVKEGVNYRNLMPRHVKAPLGVEVVDVKPRAIQLRFERAVKKVVPVVAVVEGEPAPGFVAGPATVEPPTVEVVGPESAMKRLVEATTEPVSVSGRRETFQTPVAVGVADGSVGLTKPVTASVTVPIQARPFERVIASVAVRPRNVGRGLSARTVPAAVTLTVRGPRDVVDGLGPGSVTAFVDLAGLGTGRYNRPVQVDRLPDAVVLRIEPATVQVTIK